MTREEFNKLRPGDIVIDGDQGKNTRYTVDHILTPEKDGIEERTVFVEWNGDTYGCTYPEDGSTRTPWFSMSCVTVHYKRHAPSQPRDNTFKGFKRIR